MYEKYEENKFLQQNYHYRISIAALNYVIKRMSVVRPFPVQGSQPIMEKWGDIQPKW